MGKFLKTFVTIVISAFALAGLLAAGYRIYSKGNRESAQVKTEVLAQTAEHENTGSSLSESSDTAKEPTVVKKSDAAEKAAAAEHQLNSSSASSDSKEEGLTAKENRASKEKKERGKEDTAPEALLDHPTVRIAKTEKKGVRTLSVRYTDAAPSSVRFAVWSKREGQNDLRFYDAAAAESGHWEAEFDVQNHMHSGVFCVHVYADDTCTDQVEFKVPYKEVKNTFTELTKKLDTAKKNDQLILVQASGTTAVLSMLNKEADGNWFEILRSDAFVGANGVGETTEWSHTTPPGVFSFGMAFGILPDPGTREFEYTQIDDSDYWVDDVDSEYYNQFVSTDTTPMTWASAEHLIEHNPSYNYSLSINYNTECTPGVGSAIFLHCWRGEPTLGCVAVPEDVMAKILQNVKRDCKIVIDNGDAIRNY